MALALTATLIVITALTWELVVPAVRARRSRPRPVADAGAAHGYDPGRERRAEQRARRLLRSCVPDEDWAMYRDLGFLRVWGSLAGGPGDGGTGGTRAGAPYAYLIYPHGPLIAYLPQTGELLSEYCVTFPDETRPYGSPRLPDSDDVLAKWLALTGDERGLIDQANMHQAGRQLDPARVRHDLLRLGRWERAVAAAERVSERAPSPDA
jgi:hypothetical protein